MSPHSRAMLQLARTPRWVAAFVLLVAFVIAAVLLGRWQWIRTQEIISAERASASQPVAIESLVTAGEDLPAEAMGHPVVATGIYDPELQSAVVGRRHAGAEGVWIVTGLRLANGEVVAVLRGSLPSADAPGSVPPRGTVQIAGVVQPDEKFYAGSTDLTAIAHDRLVELWHTDLLPGFVTLTAQQPMPEPAPSPVAPTMSADDVPFPLQNFFYAFQWWIFAVFAIAVYWRWLRIEAKRSVGSTTT